MPSTGKVAVAFKRTLRMVFGGAVVGALGLLCRDACVEPLMSDFVDSVGFFDCICVKILSGFRVSRLFVLASSVLLLNCSCILGKVQVSEDAMLVYSSKCSRRFCTSCVRLG